MNKIVKMIAMTFIVILVIILGGHTIPQIFGAGNGLSCLMSFLIGCLGGFTIMEIYYE